MWTCFNRMLNLSFSCHHVGPLSAHYTIYSRIVLCIRSFCVQWYHVKTLFKVRLTQPHWFSHHLKQNEALMKVTVFLHCIQYFVVIPWVSVPHKYGPTRSSTHRCHVICLYVAYYTVYSSPPSATYVHLWTGSALVQVMACRLFDAKPFPEPMPTSPQLDPWEHTSVKFKLKYKTCHAWKCSWSCRLWNGCHFVQVFCPDDVIKTLSSDDAYMHHWPGSPLVQVITCCLRSTKWLTKPMTTSQLCIWEQISVKFWSKY